MSSDVEMSDCGSLASDIAINIDPEVAAGYSPGPKYVVHRGKTYQWHQHTDHTRAFCKLSVIWSLGDDNSILGVFARLVQYSTNLVCAIVVKVVWLPAVSCRNRSTSAISGASRVTQPAAGGGP
jgi:hypothetical protein